jgi:virginiamycin A acetyltransferase
MTTIEAKLAAYLRQDTLEATALDPIDARRRGVRLHRSFWNRAWVEEHAVMASPFIHRNASAFIGLHSYMNDGGYARGRVFIGRYCSIGRRVSIGASSHSAAGLSTSPAARGNESQVYSDDERAALFGTGEKVRGDTTIIENDVWIGDGAILLRGVRLGTGCIVGANAVVTRDVEPYAVVAGLPARRMKSRFPAALVERLMRSAWWNLPPAYLRALPTSHVLMTLDRLEADTAKPQAFENFMTREVPAAEK